VENGNPQHIANTAWACVTLGVSNPKMLEAIKKKKARLDGRKRLPLL
jgi:hypothetical protein